MPPSTSHDFGAPKEHAQFWEAARARFAFDPARSLFADDNSKMLDAARAAGVRWVYGVRHWDTQAARGASMWIMPPSMRVADLLRCGDVVSGGRLRTSPMSARRHVSD